MNLLDTISLSFRTIRSNKLRTGITVAIIALGIASLIGIRTAIEAMTQKFTESFSAMGANGFSLRYRQMWRMQNNDGVKKEKKGEKKEKLSNQNKPISKQQAEAFKQAFKFPSQVGLSMFGTNNAIINFENKKTNPTVRISGGDDNFVDLNGYKIASGRNLNDLDVQSGRNVCLLGKTVASTLFGENAERPVEKIIRINGIPFRVIGVLEEKGSTLGFSWDNSVVTSYNNVRRFFKSGPNASFSVGIKVKDVRMLDAGIGEAEGTFRSIRKLATTEGNNFIIDKSDSFVDMLLKNLQWLTISAIVIGFITLMGAAIGLMNIMLVAVTERTKEVGLIKAIGGKQRNVRNQFLYESIIISLLGAGFGIFFGILLGNSVSILMSTGFVVPWAWVLLGIFICSLVGLLAGLYPAFKASRLNPIEALRYE
ncbi:MAG TPA: ABC transporter permease [Chitinophagaceae bacterium]|nr:ABC transporter permease [Chitinophagaceae bacterium]